MQKIYRYLIATLQVAVFGLAFGACEPASRTDYGKTVVYGSYDSEVYAREVVIDRHVYYMVYATCDGRPGHTVRQCQENHCFLQHSTTCPCMNAHHSSSVTAADDEDSTESKDPFDW